MHVLEVTTSRDDGAWRRGSLVVRCSTGERERLLRLADVFHPELHVVGASDASGGPSGPAGECVVRLRVAYPSAHAGRLESILERRLREVIPGLDIGRFQEAG